MHVERDGYVGIADVGDGMTNVALVVPAAECRTIADGRDAYLDAWLARHQQLGVRFARATRVTPVRATGPFASRVRQAWIQGAALVGDAADFFDPFTGEGIYAALRGGELLAPFVVAELAAGDGRALAAYDRARISEFSGKWTVERIIAAVIASPPLINYATRALRRRTDLADLLVGVTGDFVPPREVLRAGYIAQLLLYGI
jgi:flavin-dependent dehydrogenase